VGGFTYTTREKVVDIGPIHATRDKTHNVAVPPVAGAVALRWRRRAAGSWEERITSEDRSKAQIQKRGRTGMLILIIILLLVFGGGGGYYGYGRWGSGGGAGVGLGTILLILLIAYLLGAFR
jgi:hypothetical protein